MVYVSTNFRKVRMISDIDVIYPERKSLKIPKG